MLTIAPAPWLSIAGSAARVARSAAKKFACIAQAKSSSLVPRNPCRRIFTAPTLLTRMSSRPWSSSARRIRRAGPSGATRSSPTAVTRSIPASASIVRAPATTRAPSRASAFVMARPIPLLAPVTTATLSSSWSSTSGSAREVRVQPGLDVCHHLLLVEVVEQVVIVALVELEGLVLRARFLVKVLAAARLGGLVFRAMQDQHRQGDARELLLQPLVGANHLRHRLGRL